MHHIDARNIYKDGDIEHRYLAVLHASHENGIRRMILVALLKCIRGCDCQRFSIGAKSEVRDAGGVARQLTQSLLIITVPYIHHAITATGGKRTKFGMERNRIHWVNHILPIDLLGVRLPKRRKTGGEELWHRLPMTFESVFLGLNLCARVEILHRNPSLY